MLRLARDSFLSAVFYIAPRFANVVLFVLIGRQTGPDEAGIFALANTYLIIATTALRGLDELVARQVAREPEHSGRYLVNFTLVRLALAGLSYALLSLAARWIFGYPEQVETPVLLLSLSVIPDGLTYVAQAVLLGRRQFGAPATVLTTISLLKIAGGAVALSAGYGLDTLAWIWFAGSCLGAVALLGYTWWQLGGLHRFGTMSWAPVREHWRPALSFILISTLLAFDAQTDTLVLSKFHAEAQVGWYNAATTVVYSLLVLSQAYRFAVYPIMTRYALQSKEKVAGLYRQSLRYISILVLPMAGGLLALGPEIVRFAFGASFAPSGIAVQILSIALLLLFLNEPNSRMMLVADKQQRVSQFLIVSTTSNIILNLVLSPTYGATGAALARVGSTLLYFGSNYLYVTTRVTVANLPRLAAPALAATAVMTLAVWLARHQSLYVSVGLGVVVYASLLVIIDSNVRRLLAHGLRLSINRLRPT